MDRFACGSTIIAIFNLVQDLMVLLRVLLQQKKDSHCLETYFHDTILLHHYRWEAYIKKYWNVAIFKLRLLNDQHADCKYIPFRGKMTHTLVVVRHTKKIHCKFILCNLLLWVEFNLRLKKMANKMSFKYIQILKTRNITILSFDKLL